MRLIESSGPRRVDVEPGIGSGRDPGTPGTRRSGTRSGGPGNGSFGSGFGCRRRSSSRRRLMISPAVGNPNGPVRELVLVEPGVGSSLGNVGAVPVGACRITPIVGSVGDRKS